MTIGFDSFVSQPSTGIWNAKTMSIETQYCKEPKMPVRNQHSSSSTTPTMATPVSRVYSGIGLPGRSGSQPAEHLADRSVRQQSADRHHDEERQLLDRHPEDQLPTGHEPRVVRPVITNDADDVPD